MMSSPFAICEKKEMGLDTIPAIILRVFLKIADCLLELKG